MKAFLAVSLFLIHISKLFAQDVFPYTPAGSTSVVGYPEHVALNLPIPNSESVNDFATSGASSEAEQGLGSDEFGVQNEATVQDPWEGYNRRMYKFNNQVDKYIARPLAVAYDTVAPEALQHCVSRFFSNLREPGTAINQALQGNSFDGMRTLGRFAINTTIGIAGLYDPATLFGLKRDYEDFGQTLAIWGWEDSRYFVAPILGPRTVRDMLGIVGDQPLSPINHISNSDVVLGLNVIQLTDARVRLLPLDSVREQALDEYVMIRSAWITRRAKQIEDE